MVGGRRRGEELLMVGGQHAGVHRGVGGGLTGVHGEPAPQAAPTVVRPARGVLSSTF